MKILGACLCLGGILFLSACGSHQPSVSAETSYAATVVTVKHATRTIPPGASLAWEPLALPGADRARLDMDKIDAQMHQAIGESLKRRGFALAGEGDYRLVYVAALEKDLTDADLNQLFGINPGYAPGSTRSVYEKGTVVIDISDPVTHESFWRAAAQGHVDYKIDDATRRLRLERLVEKMFSDFP